jgi:hypothetical protein
MTGKSNLLLERKDSGAGTSGMILMSRFETMSGCISDSTHPQQLYFFRLISVHTLIADQKHPRTMFCDAQRVVLHAG